MIDVADYIGLAFAPGGRGPRAYDCWGLVRQVYADRLGIILPLHIGYADTLTDTTADMIEAGRADWQPTAEPQPWDVVLFNVAGRPNHIGLVIGEGYMLHTARHKDACIESYRAAQWRTRIEDFYRYADDRRPPAPAAH